MQVAGFCEDIVKQSIQTENQLAEDNATHQRDHFTPANGPSASLPPTTDYRLDPSLAEALTSSHKPFSSKKKGQKLIEVEAQKRVKRKRCSNCYKKFGSEHGAGYARKRA